MTTRLDLGEIFVDVVFKDIKNVHLSVHPPTGEARISAPSHMNIDTIRVYAISRLDWIKRHQKKLRQQERESQREYLDRESHYVWGKRYLLQILEKQSAPSVTLKHNKIVLQIRPNASEEKKQEVIDAWYRTQLRDKAAPTISRFEALIGVKVERLFVQKMKTRWGSCNPRSKSIRLNSELTKKPIDCLEYIVLHEMAHLIRSKHDAEFIAILEQYMPQWQHKRESAERLATRPCELGLLKLDPQELTENI